MSSNPLPTFLELGQSIWYDFISRDFISTGAMQQLVDKGLRGMTSNPTIFEKAISKGEAYDAQIKDLASAGRATAEIATELFVTDIRNACDVLRPVYDASNGADGFISLEVNPKLAKNEEETLREARHLWQVVDRPNLMIKIPATSEGLPAVRQCLAENINVNITLMFSLEQYKAVAEAYISALEERHAAGKPVAGIASVASVFVSRIDAMVDEMLEKAGGEEALALRGKAALANTKLVYKAFLELFSGDRWEPLARAGARPQRPLWASTSTKNPSYPDLLYVEPLIGPHTVNTVPPETLEAIFDHARPARTIEDGMDQAAGTMERLSAAGIDMDRVMSRLLEEGVEKFEKSFDTLFEKLEEKRAALLAEAAPQS